jgi:hypothetical protein
MLQLHHLTACVQAEGCVAKSGTIKPYLQRADDSPRTPDAGVVQQQHNTNACCAASEEVLILLTPQQSIPWLLLSPDMLLHLCDMRYAQFICTQATAAHPAAAG